MRPISKNHASYTPNDPPDDPTQLKRYLQDEFERIALALQALSLGHLEETTSAPPKPRSGDIRYADGTLWNPGTGRGIYYFDGSVWKQLG